MSGGSFTIVTDITVLPIYLTANKDKILNLYRKQAQFAAKICIKIFNNKNIIINNPKVTRQLLMFGIFFLAQQ